MVCSRLTYAGLPVAGEAIFDEGAAKIDPESFESVMLGFSYGAVYHPRIDAMGESSATNSTWRVLLVQILSRFSGPRS